MIKQLAGKHGAIYIGNKKAIFKIWAPEKDKMTLHLIDNDEYVDMKRAEPGYFIAEVDHIAPGTRYKYKPDETEYPDPASYSQPEGVHGPSQLIDHHQYKWNDAHWKGVSFQDMVFYEIHTGTFTPEGTFDAIIPRLKELSATGINAIELMPVGQFPGSRNWGYDGVYPYAVQHSYGGPDALKRLVDACHQANIAVFLDVIYNHLGPEGNYFAQFGPYFTSRYSVPWGDALNFDDKWSDGVRDYFSDNAIYWFDHFHIDGLRLDAIHTMFDSSAVSFWQLIQNKVREFEKMAGRHLYMVAESDLNSPCVVKCPEKGGYGFDAQWLDDFHHALYTLLDHKGKKRYEDYGTVQQLAKAFKDGFVLSGDWSKFRKKKFGASSADLNGDTFIAFNQNHDQVGNRIRGERLSRLVDFERLKLAAAAILLSPYIPMFFMGEEYGEEAPFYYFTSHSDGKLIEAVQEGRKKDFREFDGEGGFPDPQDEDVFNDSKVDWENRKKGKHSLLLNWHRTLITLRNRYPALKNYDKNNLDTQTIDEQGLVLIRKGKPGLTCIFNLSENEMCYRMGPGNYILQIDSKASAWMEDQTIVSSLPDMVSEGQLISLMPLQVAVYTHITHLTSM